MQSGRSRCTPTSLPVVSAQNIYMSCASYADAICMLQRITTVEGERNDLIIESSLFTPWGKANGLSTVNQQRFEYTTGLVAEALGVADKPKMRDLYREFSAHEVLAHGAGSAQFRDAHVRPLSWYVP